MKKILYILAVVLIGVLALSNTSKSDFLNEIENSTDPEAEFYIPRVLKEAKPILAPGKYFSSNFDLDYTNLGILSIAHIKYGWEGNVNKAGIPLDKNVRKSWSDRYLSIFGKTFKLNSSQNIKE